MRVLIAGCGYVGLPLGAALVRQGHEVFGLRRSAAAAGELNVAGIKPLLADLTQAETLAKLPRDFDWVVNCTAAGGGGAENYRQVYLTGNCNLIEWLRPTPPRKYVYTSSTSVYAQNDGSLVTEADPVTPLAATGKVLVETEKLLLATAQEKQFPAVILRVAGIYGPGRGYWLRQFLAGEARLEGTGERLLNMIHRDDVGGAILATLTSGRPGEIYNAVDDEPVSQLALFTWLASRLGKPLPPFVPELANETRRRGVTNKRVSNQRLKQQTGYEFKYPTFREGYAAELLRLEQTGAFVSGV